MIETINEPISVNLTFKSKTKEVSPTLILWQGRLYKVKKVGLHHFYKKGKTLFHIFSVTDGNLFFRLCLNSETLHWVLEKVTDGEIN